MKTFWYGNDFRIIDFHHKSPVTQDFIFSKLEKAVEQCNDAVLLKY